jgi:cytochrome c oxidase assembly factor 3
MSEGLRRAREPYRIRNALVGLGLGAFAIGVWAYSISAVKQDVFDDVDEEARALGAGQLTPAASGSATRQALTTTVGSTTTATPALPAAAGIAQGTANLVLTDTVPLPPVTPPAPAPVVAKGVLAKAIDKKWPSSRVIDPESKTFLWGAPSVDNVGKMGVFKLS